jgi:hypothetical protein
MIYLYDELGNLEGITLAPWFPKLNDKLETFKRSLGTSHMVEYKRIPGTQFDYQRTGVYGPKPSVEDWSCPDDR